MLAEFFDNAIYRARATGRLALNALAPAHCPATGDKTAAPGEISPRAWRELHFIDEPYCDCCGVPFSTDWGAGALCPSCIAEPPSFDRARAAVVFNNDSGGLVSSFKYGDRTELTGLFAGWMARAAPEVLSEKAILTPVPLHWRRLASRRYNQSAMLAREVAALVDRPVLLRAMKRTRATPPQRQTLGSKARRRNVAGAFEVRDAFKDQIRGAHMVLIDDVLTSGATLSACARALRRAGASRIDALVLARVVKGGGEAI